MTFSNRLIDPLDYRHTLVAPTPWQVGPSPERVELLESLIRRLPYRHQATLKYVLAQLPQARIGEILGVKQPSVSYRVARAQEALRWLVREGPTLTPDEAGQAVLEALEKTETIPRRWMVDAPALVQVYYQTWTFSEAGRTFGWSPGKATGRILYLSNCEEIPTQVREDLRALRLSPACALQVRVAFPAPPRDAYLPPLDLPVRQTTRKPAEEEDERVQIPGTLTLREAAIRMRTRHSKAVAWLRERDLVLWTGRRQGVDPVALEEALGGYSGASTAVWGASVGK